MRRRAEFLAKWPPCPDCNPDDLPDGKSWWCRTCNGVGRVPPSRITRTAVDLADDERPCAACPVGIFPRAPAVEREGKLPPRLLGQDGVTVAVVRECRVPKCGRDAKSKGLCAGHAHRLYRDGEDADLVTPINSFRWTPSNPWAGIAPPCPWGHPRERVFLWHPDPEDGLGRWICSPCGRRFPG